MKLLSWLKSLSIWAIIGAIVTAIIMVLNARRAGALEATTVHQEGKVFDLQNGTGADILEAKKLQEKIAANKVKAQVLREKSELAMETVANVSETISDIAVRFNRVRKPANSTAKSGPSAKNP
jgi:hypothetical protein